MLDKLSFVPSARCGAALVLSHMYGDEMFDSAAQALQQEKSAACVEGILIVVVVVVIARW